MKITIKSDGTPNGTKITSKGAADLTGHVAEVTFSHRAGELPELGLELAIVELEVHGQAPRLFWHGLELAAITLADGSVLNAEQLLERMAVNVKAED